METINIILFLTNLIAGSVRLTPSILVPAIGEIFSERSGVLNLGIEGTMLMGALAGLVSAFYSGSIWLGLIIGVFSGMLMGLIMAFWSVTLRTNQIVTGFGLTMVGEGLTLFLSRFIFGNRSEMVKINPIDVWEIPILSDLPVLGKAFFQQSPLVYIAYVLVPISSIILFKTKFGLNVRAVGENPQAADTKGINVFAIRYICILIGGALAGFGGAYLSLASLSTFIPNMTAGRGFIAIAVTILARWNPKDAIWASLLFGAAYSLEFRLQAFGVPVPHQLLNAFPYTLALLVLIFVSRRTEVPSALTIPYSRESKE